MAIFKINKTKDYTVMSNYHLKEKGMSLKAKGLLCVMLSLPKNWDYSIAGLVSICIENETSIKTALSELKRYGYLEIVKLLPNETENGRIDYIYNIYEKPKQGGKKQEVEIQPLEIQPLEFLEIENQGQYNTNNKILNNKINNNISSCIYLEEQFARTIAPIEYEKIKQWEETFTDDVINYAIDKAVLNNIKTFNYIEGILRNWKTCNYKTLQEIKDNEEKRYSKEEVKKQFEEIEDYNWLEEE